MGCFSFICQKCGKGVKSSSFSGEQVHLFLLKEGNIIQRMTGEYNSYGTVFIDNTQSSEVSHSLRESAQWDNPFPERELDEREQRMAADDSDHWKWSRVCDLMFDRDIASGIAAIHIGCFDGELPKYQSQNDPNQGWGDDDEEDYFGNTDDDAEYPAPKPIPGYDVEKELKIDNLKERIFHSEDRLRMEQMMQNNDKPGSGLAGFIADNIERMQKELDGLNKQLEELKAR